MKLQIIACSICMMGLSLPPPQLRAQSPQPTVSTLDKEVARVAATIDKHIENRWAEAGVIPAPAADDAEFCRRVHLSIAGRIPFVSEIKDFLEDETPNKRRRLVDGLLESNGYVKNFSIVWRKVLIPEAATAFQTRFFVDDFENWLTRQLVSEHTRFNELVKTMLSTPLNNRSRRFGGIGGSPLAFFQAKENMPENLAAATSRMFLGIRLECAQCHEHPFDRWTQRQFWSYAAFFARAQRREQSNLFSLIRNSFDHREIAIPDTDIVVKAAFLDGAEPGWKRGQTSQEALAEWITSPKNPYFAKATVNRIWGHLFGMGIVDPVDDFADSNPPSHPELLDELARELIAHNYDLKFVVRAITASRTYQLSSRKTHPSQQQRYLFARSLPQPLTPEQLLASLSVAVGRPQLAATRNISPTTSAASELFDVFGSDTQGPHERTATILQSLAMMNGRLIADAVDLQKGQTLGAVINTPWLDTAGRITTLYLATVSRPPRPEELARLVKFVDSGGSTKDPGKALGDVFWMLLNSSEFLLNS